VHAEVPGRGRGPGHVGGWDPSERRAVPESRGTTATQGASELGRAGSRPTTILVPKFSKYFTLSFHAFIIHVCCILIDYVYTSRLDNAVPEPFFEDFQFQAFEESQLFFADQQRKLP
jgi:hypothetical protein